MHCGAFGQVSGCINHGWLVHIEYASLDILVVYLLGPHRFVYCIVVSHVVSPLFHSFSLICYIIVIVKSLCFITGLGKCGTLCLWAWVVLTHTPPNFSCVNLICVKSLLISIIASG